MKNPDKESKFIGCVLGVAVADSLGSFFEGSFHVDPEKVERTAELNRFSYTDDTHMTIGVAESLIQSKGFEAQNMANTFIKNYELEPYRGYGPGPPNVFKMIRQEMSWKDLDKLLYPGGSFGNGSAMRVAPIGLLYHENPMKLREVAYESSRITHSHKLGAEAAALQAYAVALAVNEEPFEKLQPALYLEKLMAFTENSVYSRKLELTQKLLNENTSQSKVALELGNSIEAFNSVPAAIYSFLAKHESFKESVMYAISLGGDTDTIGAMTGAIAGAYHGFESIPNEWTQKLENRGYLEELGHRLWKIKNSTRPR